MSDTKVRYPVKCPNCGKKLFTEFPSTDVAAALLNGRSMRLHSSCHDETWAASDIEMAQIREYLGVVWLEAQRDIWNPKANDSR
ncbi:MAG TPA: hypothetical protein VGD54_16530 [Steroidobacteraceae bacterium]